MALDDPRSGLTGTRFVCEWRAASDLLAFGAREEAASLLAKGPLTPDHVIRTKGPYLYLKVHQAQDGEDCRVAIDQYADAYTRYFRENEHTLTERPTMLDPHPRVVVIEDVGILAFGRTKKDARIAADIAEHTLRGKAAAYALGEYVDLPAKELFEMEYWSLEQAKLGSQVELPLQGQVAFITGAAGAIGAGIAEALVDRGAHVFLTDLDEERLQRWRRSWANERQPRTSRRTPWT